MGREGRETPLRNLYLLFKIRVPVYTASKLYFYRIYLYRTIEDLTVTLERKTDWEVLQDQQGEREVSKRQTRTTGGGHEETCQVFGSQRESEKFCERIGVSLHPRKYLRRDQSFWFIPEETYQCVSDDNGGGRPM